MGSHATGTVFWGYDLGDMHNEDYDFVGPDWLNSDDEDAEEVEWQDRYAEVRGVEPVPFPEHAWQDGPGRQRGLDKSHPDAITWHDWRVRVGVLADSQPFELASYGHFDGERFWCVRARASVANATYECVRLGALQAPPEWHAKLDEFMALLELPVPSDPPGWFLTSDYG